MRGDARVPDLVENVELGARARRVDGFGDEADLVDVVVFGKAHRVLVEGGEVDRVGKPLVRSEKRGPKVLQRRAAAVGAGDADLDRRRVAVAEVDEEAFGRPLRADVFRGDAQDVEREAGVLRSQLQEARVAHDK